MDRETLLEEVWKDYIKPDILVCSIIQKGEQLKEECYKCDCYHICREMIIGEKEEV